MNPLRISLLSSEATPFAKTGGLADVASALTRDLARRGHDVRLFLPLYRSLRESGVDLRPHEKLQDVPIELGEQTLRFSIAHADLADSDAEVWLVDCPELYDRAGIYTQDRDEPLRFALLSRAALRVAQLLQWAPDVVHCNDWHTGLTPLYLKTEFAWDELFRGTRTLLTIHNIGYQGVFSTETLRGLGLAGQEHLLHAEDVRGGVVNFLRTGVQYADGLTTVSDTYAREIQTPEFGMGLESLLQERESDLVGIVNGVDYGEWDPSVDPHLVANYGPGDLAGKRAGKRGLMEELELSGDDETPLLAIVSRLTYQKGLELLPDVLTVLMQFDDVRLAVLGSGDEQYEQYFGWLHETWPDRVAFVNRYDERLAHRIEAGADIFLMPSRYEPCGLNQMYSMRYGTPPVVRRTGGLADTVQDFDPETGEGVGFTFGEFESHALLEALRRALAAYREPDHWRRVVANGMRQDWSWERQGGLYVELYERLIQAGR